MALRELLPDRLTALDAFVVERVLSDGAEGKGSINVLGHFQEAGAAAVQALVKLVRQPLPTDDVQALISAVALQSRAPYSGMEYGYFQGTTPRYGMLSVDVLCPDAIRDDAISAEQRASLLAKHITRSTAQASHLVRETPAAYAAVHAPVIAALPPSALGWVYKILAKEKEVERLLCDVPGEDGFVLNVDPKWSTHPQCEVGGDRSAWRGHAAVRDLYLLGLCHRRDVASLRDLRARHLPMLRGMRDAALALIQSVYGLPPDQIRAFVHYPPQFYHFHVHFTALSVCIGNGCFVERAHLLDDIIDNIAADSEHYARCTLTLRVGDQDPLWQRSAARAAA